MPDVNVINLDYKTLFEEAKNIKATIPDLEPWDIDNPNDPLRFTLDATLLAVEKLGKFANNGCQEFSLATLSTRDSAEDKAFFAGYNVTNRAAALGKMTLTCSAGSDITAPPYSIILVGRSSDGKVIYAENSESVTILGSVLRLDGVNFIGGKSFSLQMTGKGLTNEIFYIQDKVIDNSINVKVNGVLWSEAIRFDSTVGPNDTRYITRKIGQDSFAIIFGDGVSGKMLITGSNIEIAYRIGEGLSENGASSRFSLYQTPDSRILGVVPTPGEPIFSGGEDEEDIEHIRKYAPQVPKIGNTIGNVVDMDTFLGSYPGVGRARSVSLGANTVRGYVLDNNGNPPGSAFLNLLLNEVTSKMIFNTYPDIKPAVVKPVSISLEVVYRPNSDATDVENQVRSNILTLLNPFTRDQYGQYVLEFGSDLLISDIIGVCEQVPGVVSTAITSPTPVTPQVLIQVADNEILTNIGSSISITMVSLQSSGLSANRNDKYLFTNPKYTNQ